MWKLKVLAIFVGLFLLASQAEGATPYETRTGWVGGSYWVDGSTGNTVEIIRGRPNEYHMNALLVINDSPTQDIFVNPSGAASDNTVDPESPHLLDIKRARYDTRNFASANTADFKLQAGEWLCLDPWTAPRVEVTGSSGYLNEGYVRILIQYAD